MLNTHLSYIKYSPTSISRALYSWNTRTFCEYLKVKFERDVPFINLCAQKQSSNNLGAPFSYASVQLDLSTTVLTYPFFTLDELSNPISIHMNFSERVLNKTGRDLLREKERKSEKE